MLNSYLVNNYKADVNGNNVKTFGNVRITALTKRVIRVEWSKSGKFEDRPSQTFVNRNTPDVRFTALQRKNTLVVTTDVAVVKLRKNSVYACFDGKTFVKEKGNLGGTRRTLDLCFGKSKLGKGLTSKSGVTVYDDSKSLLFNADGQVVRRSIDEKDLYVFLGKDYNDILQDFYLISGKPPLLPRYAFGNWWSRYYAYTQSEYLQLMDEFAKRNVPLAVSVIDMDWHYVNLKKDFPQIYGNNKLPKFYKMGAPGWTGFTVNKQLFPDVKQFLQDLRNRNLKVTFNLHPAQGVFPHEDAFEQMAKEFTLGKHGNVEFDFSSEKFINAYFETLLKPLKGLGVDFWWIDWQQGNKSKLDGLDPLFALNHYHYLENAQNKRGLILSRYCGLGAHRYPVGFSGDTLMLFSVLKFIPYFTSTATNVGYGLWSHDIGGHMLGYSDEQLYLRWIQFGVFSPINRLHSSCMPIAGKEPWNRDEQTERISQRYLRLRHRLVPYIYSEHLSSEKGGRQLCAPLYYYYPNCKDAYAIKNSYMFGSQLFVLPVTDKINAKTHLACQKAWLPQGKWYDLITRNTYSQGYHYFGRTLSQLPLLIKEGGILPLNGSYVGTDNPTLLDWIVVAGNGKYTLLEDDGQSVVCNQAQTVASVNFDGNLQFDLTTQGDVNQLPSKRTHCVKFVNVASVTDVIAKINGKTVPLSKVQYNQKVIFTNDVATASNVTQEEIVCCDVSVLVKLPSSCDDLRITLVGVTLRANKKYRENLTTFLSKVNGNNRYRTKLYYKLDKATSYAQARKIVDKLHCNKNLKQSLYDLIDCSTFDSEQPSK